MPRHSGYCPHPQKCRPACTPLVAVRKTICVPQFGHSGWVITEFPGNGLELLLAPSLLPSADCPEATSIASDCPSISSIFDPVWANRWASAVNCPEVMTMPLTAPRCVTTPSNSRTGLTPTRRSRHCLHCTSTISPRLDNSMSTPPSPMASDLWPPWRGYWERPHEGETLGRSWRWVVGSTDSRQGGVVSSDAAPGV